MDPRFNPREATPDSEEIVFRFKKLSASFRSGYVQGKSNLDIVYGADPHFRYDLFLPSGAPQSLLVFVHGGFWFSRDKSDFSFVAKAHAERGSAVAVLTYPKCPEISLPDLMDSMSDALSRLLPELQSKLALNSSQTALVGHSAGAHLVASAMIHSKASKLLTDAVGLCLLVSGIYDTDLVCSMDLNVSIGLSRADTARTSLLKRPMELCLSERCRFVSLVGGREPRCWQQQIEAYLARFTSESNLSPRTEVLAGHDHFTILEALSNPSSEIGLLVDTLKSGDGENHSKLALQPT